MRPDRRAVYQEPFTQQKDPLVFRAVDFAKKQHGSREFVVVSHERGRMMSARYLRYFRFGSPRKCVLHHLGISSSAQGHRKQHPSYMFLRNPHGQGDTVRSRGKESEVVNLHSLGLDRVSRKLNDSPRMEDFKNRNQTFPVRNYQFGRLRCVHEV